VAFGCVWCVVVGWLCPDSRLTFWCSVRQTHRMHLTEGIIFADVHRARCTGTKAFRNGGSRNDWVWVQTGGEANYGDLGGRVVARLLAPFKIRNILSEAAAVHRLALVRRHDLINGGRFHIPSGHIRVGKRINGRDMRIVSIGAVIGQAQVIPSGENNR